MPPIFQPVKTIQSVLEQTAIVDGKVYFAQDSERLFFDYDSIRTEIRDIVIIDTDAERIDMLAPKNKFYFVLESSSLWLYKNGDWYQVSGGASEVSHQMFEAGDSLGSVQLAEQIPSASAIIAVNVDNTNLMRENFSLGEDFKTIIFSEPISCELGIEVIYFSQMNSSVSGGSSTYSLRNTNQTVTTLTTNMSRSTASTEEKEIVLTANCSYSLSLTGHTSLSFGSWVAGENNSIVLYLQVPDAYTLTLPADVKWKNGLLPELEVDGTYILEFKSINGGSTVYGSIDKYI